MRSRIEMRFPHIWDTSEKWFKRTGFQIFTRDRGIITVDRAYMSVWIVHIPISKMSLMQDVIQNNMIL